MPATERSTTVVTVTKALRSKVLDYVRRNGHITNRQCRDLLELGYDQVISLFNQMVEMGICSERRDGEVQPTPRLDLPAFQAITDECFDAVVRYDARLRSLGEEGVRSN